MNEIALAPLHVARATTERTMFAAMAQMWVVFAVMRGLDMEEVCRAAGFAPADLADRDCHIPYAWYVSLRRVVIERLPNVAVGIELGTAGPDSLQQFGYLGHAMQACATWLEATQLAIRYARLADSGAAEFGPRLEMVPAGVAYVVPQTPDDPAEGVEAQFIGSLRLCRGALARRVVPLRVCFTHHRESLRQRLEEIFGTSIEFGADSNRIVWDPEIMQSPMPSADCEAKQNLQNQLDKLMQKLETPFVAVVARTLETQLASGNVSQAQTAKRLGLSSRTLHRRLKEHGLRYQQLVMDTRRAFAERLLADGKLAIYEIAFAVGYEDVSSFQRAWKSWTGLSPRAYRESQSNGSHTPTTRSS
jgi:AraC-like DNA-binding protein